MEHSEEIVNKKIEILKDECKKRNMRVTPQRIVIYREVAKSCEHPDAEAVYEAVKKELPNISFDTVYRTLASLEEMGMIFRVDNQLPKARFDADRNPHHHFLCMNCGEVYDVCLDENENLKTPAKARRREGRANRGGTANFRPLPNSHLAGAFIFALAATNGGKTHDDL